MNLIRVSQGKNTVPQLNSQENFLPFVIEIFILVVNLICYFYL